MNVAMNDYYPSRALYVTKLREDLELWQTSGSIMATKRGGVIKGHEAARDIRNLRKQTLEQEGFEIPRKAIGCCYGAKPAG